MYDIREKSEAIREIKKYLFLVSERMHPDVPRVTIDGIYDTETGKAVTEFQKIQRLPATGVVDYDTFQALYADYKLIIDEDEMQDYVLTSRGFPISQGAVGEDVRALNMLISELSKEYPELAGIRIVNAYTAQTARAVSYLRSLFGYPGGEQVDKQLYDRMLIELSAQRRKDKSPAR